ncbi:MAG: tetratricopeptide repeat protein, partial [Planctomycetes bacterium]|nr:tetratricopeptide repeat protein [Planctomycetota bacterium]
RDIKPSNLIIGREGRIRILDFGLARTAGQESLTMSGDIVGTPLYMSPEQAQARKIPIDHRTDIFSLGAAMYDTFTRRPPFQGKTCQETLSRIIERDPIIPSVLDPRIPRDLETIVLKCLRKDPADRYHTAEALAQDLRRFARGDPIEARAQSTWERSARRIWRNRRKVLAGGIIGILLIVAGGLLWMQEIDHDRFLRARYAPRVGWAVATMHFGRPTAIFGSERMRRLDPLGQFLMEGRPTTDASREADPVGDAAAELRRQADLVPELPDASYHLARALVLLGDEADALRELERAIERDPGFVPARILKKVILERQGDAAEARAELLEAEGSIHSEWARALLDAHVAVNEARWEDAAVAYTTIIEMERNGGRTYIGSSEEMRLGRGTAYLRAKDFTSAFEDFSAVRAQWPEALDPVLLLYDALFSDGKEDEAERRLDQFFERTKYKDMTALAVAARHHVMEEHERGLRWAERIKWDLLRDLTRMPFLIHLGRTTEAIRTGERILAVSPDAPLVHTLLAWAYNARTDAAAASRMIEAALRRDPERHSTHFHAGLTAFTQGKLEASVGYLRRAIDIEDTIPARLFLAAAFALQGKADEAYTEFRESLRLGARWAVLNDYSEDVILGSNFGPFLERIERPREALEYYRRVLVRVPRARLVHLWLAGLLRRQDPRLEPDALAEFIEWLEAQAAAPEVEPAMLATLARALAYRPGTPDLARALDHARRAVAETDGRSRRMLAALAEIQILSGSLAEAVVTLERALGLPDIDPALEIPLARCRRDLLPRLVSYESVDALLTEGPMHVLIGEDATWAYWKGELPPSARLAWTRTDFDDGPWPRGAGAFATPIGFRCETCLDDMAGAYTSFHIRHRFLASGTRPGARLLVWASDGFVAYLNGEEVARVLVAAGDDGVDPGDTATGHGRPHVPYRLSIDAGSLAEGENCLAILGMDSPDIRWLFSLNASLLAGTPPDAAARRGLLAAFARVADPNEQGLLRYMEGRLLQLEGKGAEAAAAFSALIERDPDAPLAHLRRAEALREAGLLADAEARLREALPRFPDREDLWNLWHEIAVLGLRLPPAQVLSRWDPRPAGLAGYGADCLWLWERLAAGDVIRINCGGRGGKTPDGTVWGPDRFFSGGGPWRVKLDAPDPSPGPLYEAYRAFGDAIAGSAGYRIPLPPGRYEVTLRFAELSQTRAGRRSFDVVIEGRRVLQAHEPFAEGFATPHTRTYEADTTDGDLDIEFVPRIGVPMISALEIRRVE